MIKLIQLLVLLGYEINFSKELGKFVLACLSKTSPFVNIEGLACPLKIEGPRYFDRAKVA